MAVGLHARAGKKPIVELQLRPLSALVRQEYNLCFMLELLDKRLEAMRSVKDRKDYNSKAHLETLCCAYAEALCCVDAVYIFTRLLLDCAAGIVRHLHQFFNGDSLPKKSFADMYKKSLKKQLPGGLNTVFSTAMEWFPELKDRRDNIIHHYEVYLIGFERDSEGGTKFIQFSTRVAATRTPNASEGLAEGEDIKSYVGKVMAGYQQLVDHLLDHWDEVFRNRFGSVRSRTILEGRVANMLWWAHRYGGYRNANMVIEGAGTDTTTGPVVC